MKRRIEHPINMISDLETTFFFDSIALVVIVLFFSLLRLCRGSAQDDPISEQLLDHRSASDAATSLSGRSRAAPSIDYDIQRIEKPEGRNVFEWVKVLLTIPDKDVIMHCRKDGFLYLLFIKYLYSYFFFLSLGSCGILLPIFLVNSPIDTNLVAAYTIQSIRGHKWKLWVVLAFTAIYSLMAFAMLYLFHHKLRNIAATEV